MDELKEAIKRYLRIDWNEDDDLIIEYIQNGINHLDGIAGASCDYTIAGRPRSLLFDYCRYARSQALEVFDKNFEADLLSLNLESQSKESETQISGGDSDAD